MLQNNYEVKERGFMKYSALYNDALTNSINLGSSAIETFVIFS